MTVSSISKGIIGWQLIRIVITVVGSAGSAWYIADFVSKARTASLETAISTMNSSISTSFEAQTQSISAGLEAQAQALTNSLNSLNASMILLSGAMGNNTEQMATLNQNYANLAVDAAKQASVIGILTTRIEEVKASVRQTGLEIQSKIVESNPEMASAMVTSIVEALATSNDMGAMRENIRDGVNAPVNVDFWKSGLPLPGQKGGELIEWDCPNPNLKPGPD